LPGGEETSEEHSRSYVTSERQSRKAKEPRPFGLLSNKRLAALLVGHRPSGMLPPRALPGAYWKCNVTHGYFGNEFHHLATPPTLRKLERKKAKLAVSGAIGRAAHGISRTEGKEASAGGELPAAFASAVLTTIPPIPVRGFARMVTTGWFFHKAQVEGTAFQPMTQQSETG
jgi:hypothetical protein